MIDLKDIVVEFKENSRYVKAVDHVSLSVDAGDIYGIVGYSGAGKSTLVRVINLLQKPTSGQVIVDGKNLETLSEKDLRAERKKIGMIFQHFNLMESRTIYQNVAFPLKGSGLSKSQEAEKIEKLLDLVGILDKKDSYPSQLSGGQKQRVAIARALANDPQILLCDEATSALDPKTTISILELLKEVNESLGITMVVITHEMQVIKEICNKVAVMEDGKILEHGDVLDIFNNPREVLTRDFIRTATHVEQAEKKILSNLPTRDIYELKFSGQRTSQPVIVDLFKKFNLVTTILYGDIEYIQNVPLGTLLVSFDGAVDLEQVQKYLQAEGVLFRKVEASK